MYKLHILFPFLFMTSSTLEKREIRNPTDLPAPETWGDLHALMNTVLPGCFYGTISAIQASQDSVAFTQIAGELRTALSSHDTAHGEPTKKLSGDLQSKAAQMLEILGILQPEQEEHSAASQGITPIRLSLLHKIGRTLGML